MVTHRLLKGILVLLVLSACQQLPTRDSGTPTADYWQASGKVSVLVDRAIYPNTENQQQTVRFDWRQLDQDFVIELSGSLGFGKASIIKTGNSVSVIRGGKTLNTASNPEQLLLKTTGLQLPISGMRYWIMGFPSDHFSEPDAKLHTRASLDCNTQIDSAQANDANAENCSIASFTDQSWTIAVLDTHQLESHVLPQRLKAITTGIKLNVVINQWRSLDAPTLMQHNVQQ